MASFKYYVDIDLNKNELLKAVLENAETHPTNPKEGQLYYNTSIANKGIWGYVDNVWIELSKIYEHPAYTELNPTLTDANVLASLQVDEEGHVIEAETRALSLSDLGYEGDPNANNYTHPDFPNNALSDPLTDAEVISDVVVNNEGHVTGFVTRDLTPADIGAAVINDSALETASTWSSQRIKDELDDINNIVTGALVYQGGYNADTNTPDLESGIDLMKGYTYTVTTGGDFLGESVQVGDMIVAEVDFPETIDNWTIVNKNIPDIVDATDEDTGIIRIATQSEVDAGTDNSTAVTPATLVSFVQAQFTSSGYGANIGDGTSTSFDISHNLGTQDVLINVFDDTTGDEVGVVKRRTTDDSVRILVNEPLTNNELRVVIKK